MVIESSSTNPVNGGLPNHLDAPERFNDLTEEERAALLAWIEGNVEPSGRAGESTSYGWKHLLQEETGLYVNNGQFKGAMLALGYEPVDPAQPNWSFKKAKVRDYRARVRGRYTSKPSSKGEGQ